MRREGVLTEVEGHDIGVILIVGSNTRKVNVDGNVQPVQERGRTDSRELENLWRADDTCGYDNLLVDIDPVNRLVGTSRILDGVNLERGSRANELGDLLAEKDVEVAAGGSRVVVALASIGADHLSRMKGVGSPESIQGTTRGTVALEVDAEGGEATEPVLCLILASFFKNALRISLTDHWRNVAGICGIDGSVCAVDAEVVCNVELLSKSSWWRSKCLGLFEVWKEITPAPAGIAELDPSILKLLAPSLQTTRNVEHT